jgi:hypothetical protein
MPDDSFVRFYVGSVGLWRVVKAFRPQAARVASRIACSNVVAMSRLLRKESAPFTNAAHRVSSSFKLVRTNTFVAGRRA